MAVVSDERQDDEDTTRELLAVALSEQDLRVVTRYAAETAQDVLSIFERTHPDDSRPRQAIQAAWIFANGDKRTKLQRTRAFAAHKAAQEASTAAAREAARAAGHAAAAAYLHPLAKPTQVRHILGAAACAAWAAELDADGDHRVGGQRIEQARKLATPALVEVLRRFPAAPTRGNRVAGLMNALDIRLRTP
jgi:hypothetical protein